MDRAALIGLTVISGLALACVIGWNIGFQSGLEYERDRQEKDKWSKYWKMREEISKPGVTRE